MDFGLGLVCYTDCWNDVAFAEEHGFATAGFADSPLLGGDAFVCLALAAQQTHRIRLGSFLAVPSNRLSAVAASAAATVNRIAPGRVFLGLGTGNTGRAVFGLRPLPTAVVARYAQECSTLLAGGEVAPDDGTSQPPYRLAHAYTGDVDPSTDAQIPVYIAADGPKALAVAGRHGDGWITTMQYSHIMDTSPEVFAEARASIGAAAEAAGATDRLKYTMLSAGMCLLEDGESAVSPRALEMAGAVAMLAFHAYAENPSVAEHLPAPIQDRLDVYERDVLSTFPADTSVRHQWTHRGHLSHLLPGEAGVLTEEIMRMTTLTGTPDEVANTVLRLLNAGLDNVTVLLPPRLTRPGVLDIERRLIPLVAPGAST